jgi:hypothetical protein
MKLFRHRRPSLKTLLGVTRAKKKLKRELGITEAMKPFRFWTNQKRRLKRKVGYESTPGRIMRNGLPTPGGCMLVVVVVGGTVAAAMGLLGFAGWRAVGWWVAMGLA